jgi:hypothetical protein
MRWQPCAVQLLNPIQNNDKPISKSANSRLARL